MTFLDTSGQSGPAMLSALRRCLVKASQGEVIELMTTDRSSMRAIPTFCENAGHNLLMARVDGESLVYQIQKKK